jgi:threonylcarbamoyladenosine tRNA methylthiotransferase MtaB
MKAETFFVYTFGCKINQYESQLIREKFIKENKVLATDIETADIIIINSCTVTEQANKQCNTLIKKLLNKGKKIILTGCYLQVSENEIKKMFPTIQTVKKGIFIPEKQKINLFQKHSRAFLKIQDGCNSFCSYCIVPFARNNMWSKPQTEIIDEINNLINNGYYEIVLSGIHIGKYEGGIVNLLKQIFNKINKNFRIRLSSIEANEVTDDLIDLLKKEPVRLCPHLHIPLQSASDNILKQMNRHYTQDFFKNIIKKLTETIEAVAITTDVIVGFPTETEEDFNQTYNFLKTNNFARLHVFPFSPRKGTVAFNLKQISTQEEIKKRVTKLLELDKILRNNFYNKFTGTKRNVVSLKDSKALTDNYLTIENIPYQKGIFETTI